MALTKAQMRALRKAAYEIKGRSYPLETPKKLQPRTQETPVPGKVVYTGKDAGNVYTGLVYGLPLTGYLDNVDDLPDYPW